MDNKPYFTIQVTKEQKDYALRLVNYSIENHKVPDIYENHSSANGRKFDFRYTGTLGEVVFADMYNLKRPVRSFGAIDGQDNGVDFSFNNGVSVDIKTMSRGGLVLYEDYAANIDGYQVQNNKKKTDLIFCITIHKIEEEDTTASFIGYIKKQDILNGKVGKLYEKGSEMRRSDGTTFKYRNDVYAINLKEITPPKITPEVSSREGFCVRYLKK